MRSILKDKRLQFAFALVIVEWVFVGVAVARGADNPIFLGGVLFVISVIQIGSIFWRRKPSGAVADAQEAFVQGDYATAITILEAYTTENSTDVKALTLLGNAYRQHTDFVQSISVLEKALDLAPDNAFPRYGLGRTLLAQGHFANAAQAIEKALQDGGRKVIRTELALAYYLANRLDDAQRVATATARQLSLEPYRMLMINYLLYVLANDEKAVAIIRTQNKHVHYWQVEANRFTHTPYGEGLQTIIEQIQEME